MPIDERDVPVDVNWEADRSARHRRAVVFACDGNYIRFAFHAAAQIARLGGEARDFDICIVSTEEVPTAPPGLAHHGVRCARVEVGERFDGLFLDGRRTTAVYARLLLPAMFADDYERLLYVDADVFVGGGDFAALLDADLGPHVLGAVRDNTQWRTPGRRVREFRLLDLPAAPYFNSGVLLVDVTRWNAHDMLGEAVAFGREHRDKMVRHDQNLLNGLLHGRFAELSPVWNWQYTWSSMLFEAMEGANVVHFIGVKKPWRDPDAALPLRFRRAFHDHLATHYPDAAREPVGRSPLADARRMRRMLLKHLASQARMQRYLARFPDPFTVHVHDAP